MVNILLLHSRKRAPLAALLFGLFAVAGCGSSGSTTALGPGGVPKCAVTLTLPGGTVPATGGTGRITVTTARECAWSADVDGGWLSIRSGGSGQGDGSLEFAAAVNPDPLTRRGAIVLNGQRGELTQAAGECVITLSHDSTAFPATGGTGRVDVRASSSMCTWTAASNADWIGIRSGASGRGSASVDFDVAPASVPQRSGSLTIADQPFAVSQTGPGTPPPTPPTGPEPTPPTNPNPGPTPPVPPSCSFTVSPATYSMPASGGSGSVSVVAASGCPWTATTGASWISIQGATSGDGNGNLAFTVAATTGAARSGTLTVAGRTVTVTQGQGCSYTISPENESVPAAGGNRTVNVSAASGCTWTASSNVPWITVSSGASGSGAGTVQLTVAATTGPSRSGSVTIAGRTYTVNQGPGCTFTLSPTSASVPAGGARPEFEVQTTEGCAWTATENSSWLSISSGSTGTGTGMVRLVANANTGPARTSTVTAAGRTFTVNQEGGCAYSLSSSGQSVDPAGGSGTVGVTTTNGCEWTSTSQAPWLTITGGGTGSGNGSVAFSAAANSGPARTGTLTIAGRTFTVTQGEACSFAIAPEQQSIAAGGGNTTVAVTATNGCGWTAASNAPWISVVTGASGSGNGSVELGVAANTGAARTGTATIAGRTFTVTQAEACSFAIAPEQQAVAASGGNVPVTVTAPAGCGWTAVPNAPWISVVTGASGSGSGAVELAVAANAGAARVGTATIAGRTFTVNQGAGCVYVVAPETIAAPSSGGPARVDVSTDAGCTWTASTSATWITVVSGASGSGAGAVDLSIAANPGAARSGVVTVAGRAVTVNQDSGCTYALSAPSHAAPVAGGPGMVSVTAAAGCPWTATPSAPWVTITAGASGAGDGTIQFAVEANATGAARTATITIGGQVFTINQE